MSDNVTCVECNSMFKTKQTLRQHMVYKHSGKIWKCDICNKTFNQSGTLATHKLLHTGFTIQCDVCDSKFRNTYDLKVHKSRYHYGNLEKIMFIRCLAKFEITLILLANSRRELTVKQLT